MQQTKTEDHCRGCGKCMPCPEDIDIKNCARMPQLLQGDDTTALQSEEWRRKMKKIDNCIFCGRCRKLCPFGLNTPHLLQHSQKLYKAFMAGEKL